jgi:uncharacterized protein HemY
MQIEKAALVTILIVGLSWAVFSKKQKEANYLNEYGNWMESMSAWAKIIFVITICLILYWFWFIL